MNAITRPSPLVPADVDLTDFAFMPLQIERLRKSKAWLICKRRPDLAFYMLNLWMRSWHERPAASIEHDDDVLADAANCSPEKWPDVRDDALRGWVKCSDGRLYHPVVAELVLEKWADKLLYRWHRECARTKKENQRRKDKGLEPLPFPAEPKPRSSGLSPGQDAVVPGTSPDCPRENSLKGEGEGEGEGECKGEGESILKVTDTESVTPTRQPRAKRAAGTKTQLPEDWRPGPELRQWTVEYIRKRRSGVSAGHELEKFRDHAKATGRTMKDWDATWRNWIREAIRREGKPNGTHPSQGNTRRPAGAIRTATNFAAALSGGSGVGPDREQRGSEPRLLETAIGAVASRKT